MPEKSKGRLGLILVVTALVLSACTVGPNYHRPVVQTPTAFHGAGEPQ